jgi:hypothetical protein
MQPSIPAAAPARSLHADRMFEMKTPPTAAEVKADRKVAANDVKSYDVTDFGRKPHSRVPGPLRAVGKVFWTPVILFRRLMNWLHCRAAARKLKHGTNSGA